MVSRAAKKILNSKNISLEHLASRKIARAFKFKMKWPFFQIIYNAQSRWFRNVLLANTVDISDMRLSYLQIIDQRLTWSKMLDCRKVSSAFDL